MSFIKFQESKKEKDLYWHRAAQDGAPFRGPVVPALKEEEFQKLTERVIDSKCAIFDTSEPDEVKHGRTYQQVLDGISNGWFKLLSPRQFKWVERPDGKTTILAYIEWGEVYMELHPSVKPEMRTHTLG
jgi:hypothetical protein